MLVFLTFPKEDDGFGDDSDASDDDEKHREDEGGGDGNQVVVSPNEERKQERKKESSISNRYSKSGCRTICIHLFELFSHTPTLCLILQISDPSLVGVDGKGKKWVAEGSSGSGSGSDDEFGDDDDNSDAEVEAAAKHLKSGRAESMGGERIIRHAFTMI